MIQIQGRQQFERAAARLRKERMSVRRYEASVYEITNTAKAHSYLVRFTRRGAYIFGQCTCEAGTPTTARNRVPMVCKHLLAAVVFHNAINAMRRAAHAAPAPVLDFDDADDPDCDERNW